MGRGLDPRRLQQGRIYRDLDGKLVYLVNVKHELCTWVPLAEENKSQQVTHCDNFLRRFKPLIGPRKHKLAA